MKFKYMSEEAPIAFSASTPLAQTVYLNTDKTKFKLLKTPSMGELKEAIESHAAIRRGAIWSEMSIIQDGKCKLFPKKLESVNSETLVKLLGADLKLKASRQELNEEELKNAVAKLRPKSISEMYALYQINNNSQCPIGYQYFMDVLNSSQTAYEFYGKIIENQFNSTADFNPRVGSLKMSYYQARVYELLGYSATKGWLLFPFVHPQSGIREHLHLAHKDNASLFFNTAYRPPEVEKLFQEIATMQVAKSTEIGRVKHLQNLILASSFRSIEQATTLLFQACIDLILQADQPMTVQQSGMQRKTYNGLLRLHNSRCAAAPTQALLFGARQAVSLTDFASFAQLRSEDPRMDQWCEWFELFVKDTKDSQGQKRKTACADFAKFLCSLPSPPLSPLNVTRAHINDYTVGSAACYRGFLAANFSSALPRNIRLNLLAQFFSFVKEHLIISHKGEAKDAPWLAQPVDIKLDRFIELIKSGTTRKAIAAHVMEEMRNVLTENDYAWSKLQGSWAHLVNEQTRALEYVWCPSAAILLYTLLSLPLRSLQARLFDSGEGDALVFDFDRHIMIPNPKQIALGGEIDLNRREGVLQIIASGMLDVVDIVGVWVPVNKTSGKGYHIPWVSDDLLRHIRYQHEWVRQYAANPNAHGIIEAQGHRNHPEEWLQIQSKFICLFRDPSAERILDPSLPVSKQKLLKLWVELCVETEQRINSKAKNESQRVKLVEKNTSGKIRALHDIHTLRVSGITDLLDRGVPLNIVSEYVAGHATYIMTLWYDKPSPGKIRQTLKACEAAAGQSHSAIPKFSESEVEAMRPYLVVNSSYEGMYTGFDAIADNAGLLQFRLSGICPGTRCEDGGLTTNGRIAAVPVGDRGPSCPQCRFWLTGPAFLLGQCIEGNQLILKIRKKVQSLDAQRNSILEAEDAENFAQADLIRGQADVEERQLNDMLTEWWHRMKLYEASVHKLDDYRGYLAGKKSGDENTQLMLIADRSSDDLSFSFKQATQLELEHFLSTCAELIPDYALESRSAALDLEMAVGKFLAINEQKDLTNLYFTMNDDQRLTAANLAVEMMLSTAEDPSKAADLLEGRTPLSRLPNLEKGLSDMFLTSSKVAKTIPIKVLR